MKLTDFSEGWSDKYKKSINCNNPKGFSQKAHCAGKKKKNETKEAPPGTYFTKSGNLVKGTLTKDAKAKGARQTDPKDNQRSKVPSVTQYKNEDYQSYIKNLTSKTQIATPRVNTVDPVALKKANPNELVVVTPAYKKLHQQQKNTQTKIDQRQGAGQSYAFKFKDPGPSKLFPAPKKKKSRPMQTNSIQELKIEKPQSKDTKGLKRSEMPQIHKDDYKEFIDYLQDNGAKFAKYTMPAKQLKATQGEFSNKGVVKQALKQLRGEPRKPVIASEDNFIIDGHHRWLLAWNTGDSVDVFKVNKPADELLKLVKKFPKTTYKDIYTEELYDFDKEQPMKSTVAVPGYGTMSIDGLMKNLVQSVTELLAKMKQGTDGMRFADYELNNNKVLTSKLSALIKALDDLQSIRKQGGARSRNIQKEQEAEQEQQELPINTDTIMGRIQEFESKQFVTPQDADLMRRGVQSLESARQTLNPKAILQLLTMVTS